MGAAANSFIGNRFGRRPVLTLATLFALLGTGLQAGAINLPMLIIARLINGVAVGFLTSAVPTLISEITKPSTRGVIMALEYVFAALGLMLAFWVAYGFAESTGEAGWRCPGLYEVGRVEEGRAVLAQYHGEEYAEVAAREITEAIALEHRTEVTSWFSIFKNNDQRFGRRTWLAVGSNLMQQLTGINISTYYAKAALVLGGLGIVGVVASVFGSFVLLDRIGRVKTMMSGSFFCMVGMILLSAGITSGSKGGGYAAAVGLFIFLFSFLMAWLPVGFIFTPVATKAMGGYYYVIFAVTNAVAIPVAWGLYPETGGLSLEGVDLLFDGPKVVMRRGIHTMLDFGVGTSNGSVEREKEMEKGLHVESAARM
ncbi:hypothetical protein RQP46_009207 [Phenoliferia psychrophenolica]